MENGKNSITDGLLAKYLLGEATDAEKQQTQQWINESPENKNHYNELRLIWNHSRDTSPESTADTQQAWLRFKQLTETPHKVIKISSGRSYNWLKAAALLLLFVGSGTAYFLMRQGNSGPEKIANNIPLLIHSDTSNNKCKIANNQQVSEQIKNNNIETSKPIAAHSPGTPIRNTIAPGNKKLAAAHIAKRENEKKAAYKTKGVICNNTPCPIEICITQTIKCNHGQASTVSTCSTLEPDQSGKLHYKTQRKLGRHCTLSIDEITIKTTSTGETIVLNADSKPSTAQDFFEYITGKKRGGIVAGIFHDDCNNDHDCGLKFDNNFGDLILQ